MTKEQQKLYDKLLKKVNEYCLGAAAEDVIAAIDALVDTYETRNAVSEFLLEGFKYCFNSDQFTLKDIIQRLKALEIIKDKNINVGMFKTMCSYPYDYWKSGKGKDILDISISKEEYEFLKEILK